MGSRRFGGLWAAGLCLASVNAFAGNAPVGLPTTPPPDSGYHPDLREAVRLESTTPDREVDGERPPAEGASQKDSGTSLEQTPAARRAEYRPDTAGGQGTAAEKASVAERFRVRSEEWTLVAAARGLTLHKPIYVFPVSWSPGFEGEEAEFIFQFSAKHRLFGVNLFFGYTQKSFWQIYNGDDSRPFRETNFNPELFYRWQPGWRFAPSLGFDFGAEHESNGQSRPKSRSWNRLYQATFLTRGRTLYYLKTWWRVPERDRRGPDDSGGDDNPDITRFMGFNELHVVRQLGRQQQLSLMLRGNPATGKGAAELSWTVPNAKHTLFYAVRAFHGYGESLIDFDRVITRLSVGIMLAR